MTGCAFSAGLILFTATAALPGRMAEFCGFYGLAVKLAAIVGPFSYGLVTWLSGGDHHRALLLTGVYFIVGLVLRPGVRTARGQHAALGAELEPAESEPHDISGRSP
ncbi:MAG: hypothetical protein U9R22_07615 [Pseudomonadota bacterium]|nr:hypothetical protein [Pseudomonadota bacterium]